MKLLPILYDFAVASLADAWIKILQADLKAKDTEVASLADAWIKIIDRCFVCDELLVASLADAWIKIFQVLPCLMHISRRIPHGCVD